MPGYSELIKNFEKIRDFVRDFFIFGYRSRGDYGTVSARSYDNERRRIQSYLNGYVTENWDSRGKTVSIASDTISKSVNPLFKVWETKSFTRNDLFLHFVILDILQGKCMSAPDIAEAVHAEYLSKIDAFFMIDAMTIRNKLAEYVCLGILCAEKQGKAVCYSLADTDILETAGLDDALSFFQNVVPAGFLGHAMVKGQESPFMYRQIFFAQALDDELLLRIFDCISGQRRITVTQAKLGRSIMTREILPIRVLSNARTGRRYLVHFSLRKRRYSTMRADYIKTVTLGEPVAGFKEIREEYQKRAEKLFALVHQQYDLKNVRMVLHIDEREEKYVLERLTREGRHGTVNRIAENTFEFVVDVPDTLEMVPWLRTFIGRIISIEGTETGVIAQFKRDIMAMGRLAGEADV